jgi:hypothetical protein
VTEVKKMRLWLVAAIALASLLSTVNASGVKSVERTNEECLKRQSCAACVSNMECGWCSFDVGRCVVGSLNGPSMNNVNCTFWDYGFCAGEAN